MKDNFGMGGFGLDQLTETIPINNRIEETNNEQALRYLVAQRHEIQQYIRNNPNVIEVHAITQPHNCIKGVAYGETYLDENNSKNMRVRIR